MTASGVEPTRAPGHHHSTEPTDDWLSTAALAAELGVTAACLTGWIDAGRDIPHLQLGEHRRFRRSQIQSLLQDARTPRAGAESPAVSSPRVGTGRAPDQPLHSGA